jgi:hypothetical protein
VTSLAGREIVLGVTGGIAAYWFHAGDALVAIAGWGCRRQSQGLPGQPAAAILAAEEFAK